MNATPTEPGRCPVAWCDQTHTPGRTTLAHLRATGPFPGPGQVRVRLIQAEHQGVLADPLVRLTYQVDGVERALDLYSPAEAGDLADVLNGVDPAAVAALAGALASACQLGGAR